MPFARARQQDHQSRPTIKALRDPGPNIQQMELRGEDRVMFSEHEEPYPPGFYHRLNGQLILIYCASS